MINSCLGLSKIYKAGLGILSFLALFFIPIFSFPLSMWASMTVVLFFSMFYPWKKGYEPIVFYKHYCFYLVLIQYLVILVSLYQIIFGDSTNWLGTGINLTKLPRV